MAAITVTALCSSVEAAERAFQEMGAVGVDLRHVSVLARGTGVDKKLVFSTEMNANQLGGHGARPANLSGLALKLSEGRRFLLDGCWAVGPIFQELADRSGQQGAEALAKVLLRADLDVKEAAAVESFLRKRGGVWLAFSEDARRSKAVEESLRALEGVKVRSFSLS